MSVRLGDIIQQIGTGTYKLVNAKDIDIVAATDGTSDGAMDGTDLLICDTNVDGTVKKITISQIDHDTLTNTHDLTSDIDHDAIANTHNLTTDIDHDALTNFVANEHIDHTSVSVSAGTGLTGGGDISANRTISLSHLGIESLSDPNDDQLLGWDDTDGAVKFIDIGANLSYDHATHTLSATGGGTPGGNDDEIQYNNGGAFGGCADLHWLDATNRLGLGTDAPACKFEIEHTLAGDAGDTTGAFLDLTGSASGATSEYGFGVNLAAGYTGSVQSIGLIFNNYSAGTGAKSLDFTGAGAANGNYGFFGTCRGVTTGDNVGGGGWAAYGDQNIGMLGWSVYAKNSATNIGVAGFGLNTGTSPTQIGGYFGLQDSTPTFTSTALLADNGAVAVPIILGRDNGTTVFAVNDGGKVGIGTATVPHGSVGYAKLAIEGTNANAAGPHVQFTTASDDYPLFQALMWQHDNITLAFDAYYDGSWKSSDAGSNFLITKNADLLIVYSDDGIAAGSALSLNTNFYINIAGGIFMPRIKSGATQAAAGAAANEVWKTSSHASLPDNVLMIGT